MGKGNDLTGKKFGRWTVLSFIGSIKGCWVWKCLCSCGNIGEVRGISLVSKWSQSCGCLQKDIAKSQKANLIHGLYGTATNMVWSGMLQRCNNERSKHYPNYGGRGITVCDRWLQFENFFTDMGEKPTGLSLDRIDNNKGYSPDNCRWATREVQANNRRSNRLLEYNGEFKTQALWSRQYGILSATLAKRLRIGWSMKDALLIKPTKNGRR